MKKIFILIFALTAFSFNFSCNSQNDIYMPSQPLYGNNPTTTSPDQIPIKGRSNMIRYLTCVANNPQFDAKTRQNAQTYLNMMSSFPEDMSSFISKNDITAVCLN